MAIMTTDELKTLLDTQTNEEFVDQQILARRPWIFDADSDYEAWLQLITSELTIGRDSLRIVGSAATGYSLSPLKPGRAFRKLATTVGRPSDIDIALLDTSLFHAAWNIIVWFDRQRRLASNDIRAKIRLDVYWGVVAQRSIPLNTDPARQMLTAVSIIGRLAPIRGYIVRCRIYRRMEDLRAYHIDSLRQLRSELSSV